MRITKQASCPAPSVKGDAGGSATGNESFVTVNDDTATLPNSRQLTAGTLISVVDGGAGNPITINYTGGTYLRDTIWVPANNFEPSTSPNYSPAPKVEIVLPTTGRQVCAVKFDGEKEAHATICFPRNIPAYPGGEYILRMYWFTDGTDVANTFAWRIGGHDIDNGGDLDPSGFGVQSNNQLSAGSYKMNASGAIGWAAVGAGWAQDSIYHLLVQRGSDSNEDIGYLLGVRCTIGVPLS